MRWQCSNLGQVPLRNKAQWIFLTLFLVSHAPPASAVFLILFPSPGPTPTAPHTSPFGADPLSQFHPPLPTNSPIGLASFHLVVSPTRRPPPLFPALTYLSVLDLLPRYLPAPGVPRRVSINVVPLFRLPPLCHHWTDPRSLPAPRGVPFLGSLTPSAFIRRPHIHSPP